MSRSWPKRSRTELTLKNNSREPFFPFFFLFIRAIFNGPKWSSRSNKRPRKLMYRERERERAQAVSFDRSTEFLYLFEKSQNRITSGESICRKRKGILYLDTCLESFERSMLAEEYNFKFNVGRSTDCWMRFS